MASDATERRVRAAKVQSAVQEYMDDYGFEGIAGDWLLIGTSLTVDAEGDPDCEYFVAMKDGTLLQHVALGLLAKGEDVLSNEVEGE